MNKTVPNNSVHKTLFKHKLLLFLCLICHIFISFTKYKKFATFCHSGLEGGGSKKKSKGS